MYTNRIVNARTNLFIVIGKVAVTSEAAVVEVDSASFTWSDPESPTLSQVRNCNSEEKRYDILMKMIHRISLARLIWQHR